VYRVIFPGANAVRDSFVIDGRHTNYLYKIVAAAVFTLRAGCFVSLYPRDETSPPVINDARPSGPGKDFLIYVDICFAVGS